MALQEGLALRAVRIQAKAVFAQEEVVEAEAVMRLRCSSSIMGSMHLDFSRHDGKAASDDVTTCPRGEAARGWSVLTNRW